MTSLTIAIAIALGAQLLLAAPLRRWLAARGASLGLALAIALALAALGGVLWGVFLVFDLSIEQDAALLWSWSCLGATAVGWSAARRAQRLPTRELLIGVIGVIEIAALVAAFQDVGAGLASPPFRALLAAPAALLLCGYFGASLGFLVGSGDRGELRLGYEAFIGRRFLLSKASPVLSTVTTISVIGVSLGVWLVIVALGVLSGFEHDLQNKIIGANSDIVVQQKNGRPFVLTDDIMQRVTTTPGVVAASPIIQGDVVVSSQANYTGAVVFGIDPEHAPAVLGLLQPLVKKEPPPAEPTTLSYELKKSERGSLYPLLHEVLAERYPMPPKAPSPDINLNRGQFEPPAALSQIIIGVEMGKGLSVGVGDRVRVISPTLEALTPVGPAPKSLGFQVAGEFTSKMWEYDARYAFLTLPAARRFFELEDNEVTGIQIAADTERADIIAADIEKRLADPRLEAIDWKHKNQTLFSALKLERVVAFVVLVMIILVASFSMVNTLTMSVIEKKKEIAILKTMGARDGGVLKLFLVQGLLVGGFGTAIGAVAAALTILLLGRFGFSIPGDVYYIDSLPVHLAAVDVVMVVLAAFLIVWDFAVFPALRGAQLEPVEGLRDG